MRAYHGPHCVADGLADSTTDKDDVRKAQYRSPADEVTQHSSDKTSEECAERGCGRDEFLTCRLRMLRLCSVRTDVPSVLKTTPPVPSLPQSSRELRILRPCRNLRRTFDCLSPCKLDRMEGEARTEEQAGYTRACYEKPDEPGRAVLAFCDDQGFGDLPRGYRARDVFVPKESSAPVFSLQSQSSRGVQRDGMHDELTAEHHDSASRRRSTRCPWPPCLS